jgi:hypothetical protein
MVQAVSDNNRPGGHEESLLFDEFHGSERVNVLHLDNQFGLGFEPDKYEEQNGKTEGG